MVLSSGGAVPHLHILSLAVTLHARGIRSKSQRGSAKAAQGTYRA